MNRRDREIAQELKREVAKIARVVDFRVFGSRARGDEDEFSDLDVFIEVQSLDPILKDQISDVVWEVGLKSEIVISALVCSADQIVNTPFRSAPIIQNIMEEGIVL